MKPRPTTSKMMKIVVDAGYHGWVGIEYEGRALRARRDHGDQENCWNGSGTKCRPERLHCRLRHSLEWNANCPTEAARDHCPVRFFSFCPSSFFCATRAKLGFIGHFNS